jgi:hypothetical protein
MLNKNEREGEGGEGAASSDGINLSRVQLWKKKKKPYYPSRSLASSLYDMLA